MFLRTGIILITLTMVGCANSIRPDKSKDASPVLLAPYITPTKEEIKARKTVKYVLEVIKPEIQKCHTEKEAVNLIIERLGAPDGCLENLERFRIYWERVSIPSPNFWFLDSDAYLTEDLFIIYGSSNDMIRLRETSNKISENIIQRYSMSTLPSPGSLWLGVVALSDNGTYLFTDSQLSRDAKIRKTQENNYFFKNPTGRYEVEYLSGLKGDDLLENLKDSMDVVKLTFISSTSASKESYFLHIDIKGRNLCLKAAQGDDKFYLNGSWKNHF